MKPILQPMLLKLYYRKGTWANLGLLHRGQERKLYRLLNTLIQKADCIFTGLFEPTVKIITAT
jgi:hypothetical protein